MEKRVLYSLAGFLGMLLLLCSMAFAGKDSRIVASSAAGNVTLAELDTAVARYLRQVRYLTPDKVYSDQETNEIKASTLTDLILRRIFIKMAVKAHLSVSDSEVSERSSIICSGLFDGDDKKFKKSILDDGWTEKEYRNNLREILLAEKMRSKLLDTIEVTTAEARTEYDREKDSLAIEEMELTHILIAAPETDMPERNLKSVKTVFAGRGIPKDSLDAAVTAELALRRQKAGRILDSLKAGADFALMANRYSDDVSGEQGGSLGVVPRGRMVKRFEDAAFSLEKGALSGVVKTEFGFHVIKALSAPRKSTPDFTDLEFTISARLRAAREAARLAALEKEWKVKRISEIK